MITPAKLPPVSARFQRELATMHQEGTYMALPGPELAMDPERVAFYDDISDERYFNERYIESNVFTGMIAFALHMFAMGNVILFTTLVTATIIGMRFGDFVFVATLVALFFAVSTTYFISARPIPIRFNRQAQVVHVPWEGGVLNLPWREVRPHTRMARAASGSYNLTLVFPTPDGVDNKGEPIEVPGAFDSSDWTMLTGNAARFEFIRRYMEQGLDAIQPHPDMVRANIVRPPSGFERPLHIREGLFTFIFGHIARIPMYWMAGGPLIDRWLRYRERQFKWPEEVERLCAPGADVSQFDTTPITPHPQVYYRPHFFNIQYVDRDGNPVPFEQVYPPSKRHHIEPNRSQTSDEGQPGETREQQASE